MGILIYLCKTLSCSRVESLKAKALKLKSHSFKFVIIDDNRVDTSVSIGHKQRLVLRALTTLAKIL